MCIRDRSHAIYYSYGADNYCEISRQSIDKYRKTWKYIRTIYSGLSKYNCKDCYIVSTEVERRIYIVNLPDAVSLVESYDKGGTSQVSL